MGYTYIYIYTTYYIHNIEDGGSRSFCAPRQLARARYVSAAKMYTSTPII